VQIVEVQQQINKLMARFVAEVEGTIAVSRTDLLRAAEVVIAPILAEAYGYRNLKSLNIEEAENFPSVDLGDTEARVAIQVTATPTIEKVRHTLETFERHKLGTHYNRLVVYVLTKKQRTYSVKALEGRIPPGLAFDPDRDIWDFQDVLKKIYQLELDPATIILRLLQQNFGDDDSLVVQKSEQEIASKALTYIEDRGIFYAGKEWEHPKDTYLSAIVIRDHITALMEELVGREKYVFKRLETIRTGVQGFQRRLRSLHLDNVSSKSDMTNQQVADYDAALIELRRVAGAEIKAFTKKYGLVVSNKELATWLPPDAET